MPAQSSGGVGYQLRVSPLSNQIWLQPPVSIFLLPQTCSSRSQAPDTCPWMSRYPTNRRDGSLRTEVRRTLDTRATNLAPTTRYLPASQSDPKSSRCRGAHSTDASPAASAPSPAAPTAPAHTTPPSPTTRAGSLRTSRCCGLRRGGNQRLLLQQTRHTCLVADVGRQLGHGQRLALHGAYQHHHAAALAHL